jgi:hypothetical protein
MHNEAIKSTWRVPKSAYLCSINIYAAAHSQHIVGFSTILLDLPLAVINSEKLRNSLIKRAEG